MNKNYYDILQINKNASPEIIEKAYKTLAKKYHPDLQQTVEGKQGAEEILKEINEAYEVLSNPEKKLAYDNTIQENSISQEEYENLYEQNQILKDKLNNIDKEQNQNFDNTYYNNYNNPKNNNQNFNNEDIQNEILRRRQEELNYQRQVQIAREKAYHDAYVQDLKNRGYKIKYKKTLKDYIKGIISILLVVVILIILWQIPFIHNFFIDLYESNEILKYIVDTFLNIFN